MPRQEVEAFKFPHETEGEDNYEIEVESSSEERLSFDKPAKNDTEQNADVEVEVIDDTPEEDRGREPSEPPNEVTDDELESYSEKVRKRIKHFSKGYHDERRAKEQALRERQELESITKRLMEENKKLKGDTQKSRAALIKQAKAKAESDLKSARAAYKRAYNNGDPDKLLQAQERLNKAMSVKEKADKLSAPSLQQNNNNVKKSKVGQNQTAIQPRAQQQPPRKPDEKALAWKSKNEWFGRDEEMTTFAYGLHQRLVREGYDTKSDEYYDRIDSRMREKFPENFGGEASERKSKASGGFGNVAPESRSAGKKKVRLTKSQLAIAKRFGLTPQQYAKQMMIDARNER